MDEGDQVRLIQFRADLKAAESALARVGKFDRLEDALGPGRLHDQTAARRAELEGEVDALKRLIATIEND